MQDQPLSALAASLMETDSVPLKQTAVHADHADHAAHGCGYGWWSFVFWFLVLAVFFYFVYFALKPDFVLKKDCHDSSESRSYSYDSDEIDNGRLLGAAIVTALILIFVFWVLSWLAQGSW